MCENQYCFIFLLLKTYIKKVKAHFLKACFKILKLTCASDASEILKNPITQTCHSNAAHLNSLFSPNQKQNSKSFTYLHELFIDNKNKLKMMTFLMIPLHHYSSAKPSTYRVPNFRKLEDFWKFLAWSDPLFWRVSEVLWAFEIHVLSGSKWLFRPPTPRTLPEHPLGRYGLVIW